MERVFITGAHTGLGLALAEELLSRDAVVYATSRKEPEAISGHPNLHFEPLDLSDLDAIGATIGYYVGELETLDAVILNAGIFGELKDLKDTSLDEVKKVMDINVWANKAIIDTLLTHPVKVRQVVAISSGAAFNGSGGWGPYSVSKSALNLLIRVYAHENPEIHFNTVAPGVVDTNMVRSILAQPADPRYSANARLKELQERGGLLKPQTAARHLIARLTQLRRTESGAFVDIRNF